MLKIVENIEYSFKEEPGQSCLSVSEPRALSPRAVCCVWRVAGPGNALVTVAMCHAAMISH